VKTAPILVVTSNTKPGSDLEPELQRKIEDATKGLTRSYPKRLGVMDKEQASVICDYVLAVKSETKLSDNYRISILNTLIPLSLHGNKRWKDFTRADIIRYLNHFRKDESVDPSHRWIGAYNTSLINIIRFFRWLYNPDLEPTKRPKPTVVQNLSKFRRREISLYKPSDMWTAEDNLLFLKYCPSVRDRCYHAMAMDTCARPHELLKLRIKDLEFREADDGGGGRYVEIVVNGKTGERELALTDSIPYVTQWISNHPQGSNREAILLPNLRNCKAIQAQYMLKVYKHYRSYFRVTREC
jgi:integrase